ncbi:heparinase II/III domain-containing protein [Flagellimonas marinaquae]
MLQNLLRRYHTIKYLKPIQVYYQGYYRLRHKFWGRAPKRFKKTPLSKPIHWRGGIPFENSFTNPRTFEFLNLKHEFETTIDWNYSNYGKLWTYNLNYFEFLNQKDISKGDGFALIKAYIACNKNLRDGKEPYPISLRLINWVKFLSQNQIKDEKTDTILYQHCQILLYNLEYHLLANHLLENAFALLFGAYYFQDERIYTKAKKLVVEQLEEQILEDGAHYELAPMYHQIICHRLLDAIHLIQLNPRWKDDDLLSFLSEKASLMRSWLEQITFQNGEVPMVGDTAIGIAATPAQLFGFSEQLGIASAHLPLSTSGYRNVKTPSFELFIDVGNIQPSYQPGHAHSDLFHFELYKEKFPVLIDTGISTYEKNEKRLQERSTASHNTVDIKGQNQSEVWGGFRVGKRASVIKLREDNNTITAQHDGYANQGFLHERQFHWNESNTIVIKDFISKSTSNAAIAHFHLHWSINKPLLERNKVYLKDRNLYLIFKEQDDIQIEEYNLPIGYNSYKSAYKIKVNFDQYLETNILL